MHEAPSDHRRWCHQDDDARPLVAGWIAVTILAASVTADAGYALYKLRSMCRTEVPKQNRRSGSGVRHRGSYVRQSLADLGNRRDGRKTTYGEFAGQKVHYLMLSRVGRTRSLWARAWAG